MAKKQTPLNMRERHELAMMPETVFVEVEGMMDDEEVFETAQQDAILLIHPDVKDAYDGSIVSEYKLVRRFRKDTKTTILKTPLPKS